MHQSSSLHSNQRTNISIVLNSWRLHPVSPSTTKWPPPRFKGGVQTQLAELQSLNANLKPGHNPLSKALPQPCRDGCNPLSQALRQQCMDGRMTAQLCTVLAQRQMNLTSHASKLLVDNGGEHLNPRTARTLHAQAPVVIIHLF